MLDRLVPAATKESRHLEVPASQASIRRPLLKSRLETEDRFEFVLDRPAVSETGSKAGRFGQRSHVGRHPEVTFGSRRRQFDGTLGGLHSALVLVLPVVCASVPSEPVTRSR